MHDWNVVITVRDEGFTPTVRLLRGLGPLHRTHFFNVLVMKVDNHREFLETVRDAYMRDPIVATFLARASPAQSAFHFGSPAEFDRQARDIVRSLAPELAGRSFHVRMHRRGLRGALSSQLEERSLAEAIFEALHESGANARMAFRDPDAIVSIETVDNRAGISLWTREELDRYPFLGLDRGIDRSATSSPASV